MRFIVLFSTLFLFAACQPSTAESEQNAAPAAAVEAQATAETPEATDRSGRIAVLDLAYILEQCKACKEKLSELEAKRDKITEDFEDTKKALDNEKAAITRKQTVLSADEFRSETKGFDERAAKKMGEFGERREALLKERQEALVSLREQILKVIAEMSAKEKIGLILDRQQVLLADSALDITEAVLKRVDETSGE